MAKHARARHVDLNISWTEDLLIITLSDNGCGFDPDAVRAEGHYGLMIMQERANEIDAFLSISSQLETGTVLMLQLPYASSALPLAS